MASTKAAPLSHALSLSLSPSPGCCWLLRHVWNVELGQQAALRLWRNLLRCCRVGGSFIEKNEQRKSGGEREGELRDEGKGEKDSWPLERGSLMA